MLQDHFQSQILNHKLYTLKRSSKWLLIKCMFSDLALIILKCIFAQIYVQLKGLMLSGALEEFSITLHFFGLKCKNNNNILKK